MNKCSRVVRVFPILNGCVIFTGYKCTIPQNEQYVGDKSFAVNRPTLDLVIRTKELDEFKEWYKTDLNFGKNSFYIDAPFFGRVLTLLVNVKTDLIGVVRGLDKETVLHLEVANIKDLLVDDKRLYTLVCGDQFICSDTLLVCT